MGIETAIIIGMGAIAAGSQVSAGRKQVKESRRQSLVERERGMEALKQQTSANISRLAASGVSLEGSPLFALEESVKTGIANIEEVRQAYASQQSQISSGTRSQVISTLFKTGQDAVGSMNTKTKPKDSGKSGSSSSSGSLGAGGSSSGGGK